MFKRYCFSVFLFSLVEFGLEFIQYVFPHKSAMAYSVLDFSWLIL